MVQKRRSERALSSPTGADILERLWVIGSFGFQPDFDPQYSCLSWKANAADRCVVTRNIDRLACTTAMDLDPSIPGVVWTRRVDEGKEMALDKGATMSYL